MGSVLTYNGSVLRSSTLVLENDYIPVSDKGAASGVATLDINTKITPSQANAYIDTISSATTLTASHSGHLLKVTGTYTITIPSELATGMEVEILNYGTGTVTVSAAAGVTLNGVSAGSKIITEQYTSAVLKCFGSTEWIIQGAIS